MKAFYGVLVGFVRSGSIIGTARRLGVLASLFEDRRLCEREQSRNHVKRCTRHW